VASLRPNTPKLLLLLLDVFGYIHALGLINCPTLFLWDILAVGLLHILTTLFGYLLALLAILVGDLTFLFIQCLAFLGLALSAFLSILCMTNFLGVLGAFVYIDCLGHIFQERYTVCTLMVGFPVGYYYGDNFAVLSWYFSAHFLFFWYAFWYLLSFTRFLRNFFTLLFIRVFAFLLRNFFTLLFGWFISIGWFLISWLTHLFVLSFASLFLLFVTFLIIKCPALFLVLILAVEDLFVGTLLLHPLLTDLLGVLLASLHCVGPTLAATQDISNKILGILC